MDDQALAELELALTRFCDEVLSDVTFPTQGGLMRRVHWLHRGREFRATLLLSPEGKPLPAMTRPARSLHFDQWPSRPIFEKRRGAASWESAESVGMWRWMLRTAGRMNPDNGDEAPGDLAGRPVRPRPGLPSLSASAAALPEPVEYESRRHRVLALPSGGWDDDPGLARS
jgi:hypothetical protein